MKTVKNVKIIIKIFNKCIDLELEIKEFSVAYEEQVKYNIIDLS
jgi:hypothetical protein